MGNCEILQKFELTRKSEQVYIKFAGDAGEADQRIGNVLIVFGTSNWLNFVPVELMEIKPV